MEAEEIETDGVGFEKYWKTVGKLKLNWFGFDANSLEFNLLFFLFHVFHVVQFRSSIPAMETSSSNPSLPPLFSFPHWIFLLEMIYGQVRRAQPPPPTLQGEVRTKEDILAGLALRGGVWIFLSLLFLTDVGEEIYVIQSRGGGLS